ncbi:unnamed protein product [Sphenostylis stenocarpa]|uniref:Uncharacterized protein n=1 Tax=Sphenostylis stenocarpa TaxID=92480 RepID=A0AA86W2C1_9FABA|nr:unnamed protein product [Sphenostylis stenocarpa]
MCVVLTRPTWNLGKKSSESNKVVFSLLLCGVYRGEREFHLLLLPQTADIICTFAFNGFCFGVNGREETQVRRFRATGRVLNLFPNGSVFWHSLKKHCHGFSLV